MERGIRGGSLTDGDSLTVGNSATANNGDVVLNDAAFEDGAAAFVDVADFDDGDAFDDRDAFVDIADLDDGDAFDDQDAFDDGGAFDDVGALEVPFFSTIRPTFFLPPHPFTKILGRAGDRFDADPAFDADADADPLDFDPAIGTNAVADLDDTATFDNDGLPRNAFLLPPPRSDGSAFLFIPCADGLDRLDASATSAGPRRFFNLGSACCFDNGMILHVLR